MKVFLLTPQEVIFYSLNMTNLFVKNFIPFSIWHDFTLCRYLEVEKELKNHNFQNREFSFISEID